MKFTRLQLYINKILLVIILFSLIFTIPGVSASNFEETEPPFESNTSARASTEVPTEYIIIGPESFRDPVKPLIDWKTRKGVPAEFAAVEDILSDYSSAGKDDLHKLREFLKDTYESNPQLKWALLLGDSEHIPIRMLYAGAEIYNMRKFYDSDHYFSSLDGTWDSNSNSIYGEEIVDEDWDSELYVGRLPVSTAAEVSTAVNKILSYERTPPAGDWYRQALFMGSLMDAPNVADSLDTPDSDEGYNEYKDNAYEVMQKSMDFFPVYYEFKELYDYDRIPGGEYSLEADELTRDNAVEEFNKGYALINFAGQARFNGDSIMQYDYSDGTGTYELHRYFAWKDLFHYQDAQKVTNGGMLPFMMMPTCAAGNFTEVDDTNLEVLFTAANGGAIGMISSTGESHRGESYDGNSYGNWWEDEEFWRLFFQNDVYQPGRALAELKSSFASNILANSDSNPRIYREAIKGNLLGLILLGDPEVPIWTNTPQDLSVNINNLTTGSVTVNVIVTDAISNEPVEDALVAISGSDIYLTGRTDSAGFVDLDAEISEPGEVDLTVTAHNYLPLEAKQDVVLAPPVIEQVTDVTLNEDDYIYDYFKLNEVISDADTPYEELIIELTAEHPEAGALIDIGGAVDIIPEQDWNGISEVTLTVSDGDYTKYMDFTVIVLPQNDAPKLYGLPDILRAWEDGPMVVYSNITAVDPDSDDIFFSDTTDLFEINRSTGRISFVPSHSNTGTYEVCVIASDGELETKGCFTVTILEVPDEPVIAEVGKLTVKTDETFEYEIIAFDDDGDKLTYSIEPGWLSINPDTGVITSKPGSDKVGSHKVKVFVTDGTNTTSTTFTLVVTSSSDFKLITMVLIYAALGMLVALGFVYKRHRVIAEREGAEAEQDLKTKSSRQKRGKDPSQQQQEPKSRKRVKKN
jgi:hypothetical protein